MHSLPTCSFFAQTPSFFAQASTLARDPAAQRISGSWNAPVEIEGNRSFVYHCLSLLPPRTQPMADSYQRRLRRRQAVTDWQRYNKWTSERFKLLTGGLCCGQEVAGTVLSHVSYGFDFQWLTLTQGQSARHKIKAMQGQRVYMVAWWCTDSCTPVITTAAQPPRRAMLAILVANILDLNELS